MKMGKADKNIIKLLVSLSQQIFAQIADTAARIKNSNPVFKAQK
jgi:hypothetical protein